MLTQCYMIKKMLYLIKDKKNILLLLGRLLEKGKKIVKLSGLDKRSVLLITVHLYLSDRSLNMYTSIHYTHT